MKRIILYIDHRFRGGAQRVMVNLANHLVEKNINVMLVCDIDINKDVSKLYPGTSRYPLNVNVKEILLDKYLDSNSRCVNKNFARIKLLRKCIKEFRPEMVLSFLGPNNLRMLVAGMGLKCKKVVSVRNDPVQEYGSTKLKKLVTNLVFLLSDGYVFQTGLAKEYFWKPIRRRSVIIFNPVDEKFFNQIRGKKVKNIISVGRFDVQKNHLLLIRAFSLIAHLFPDENLLFYGTGPLQKEMEQLGRDLGISDRIYFMSVSDHIEQELAKSKLFVLSSDYEGMPNALMEAMAVGVPCIATDCRVGGPRILFGREMESYLVPCNDEKRMAAVIKEILEKSEDERFLISDKMRKCANVFRSEKIYKQWDEFLETVLK